MHVVKIKIVHAAWFRDHTWPADAVAPEPDDILLDNEPSVEPAQSYLSLSTSWTEHLSGVTTPCLTVNRDDVKLDDEQSASGTTGF